MSSKAIRNELKANEYKKRIAQNEELLKNRVITYYGAFKEAELRAEFPLALMRINSFEMYDCLRQVNEFFGVTADFLLKINAAGVLFELYDMLNELIKKQAAQVLHHHIKKKSYKRVLKAFIKKLREIEVAFATTGYIDNGLADQMNVIFLKNQGFFARVIWRKISPEKRFLQKKQQLEKRISCYKEL